MASSTAQSILDYTRRHHLTCDPEWTFDFAEDLVLEVSVAFQLAPHAQSLPEDIKHTWRSLGQSTAQARHEPGQLLGALLQETWLVSQGPLAYAKAFRDSVKRSKHLQLAGPEWWDDGLFEPQLTHMMGDYLLQRKHIRPATSLQPDDLETVKHELAGDGQQTLKDLAASGEKPILIPAPEDLSDATLQLSAAQYQIMKENKLQREEMVRTCSSFVNVANDLLESDPTLPSEPRHAISPPLMSRQAGRGSAESWSRMTKEVVSSVINSLQAEEVRQSSPILSSGTWDHIDSCLRPSCTPPSSPSPRESKHEEKEAAVDFLCPSADPDNWEKLEGLENPFETVLFSRTEGVPLHLDRSTSCNPRNHWNMASCLFDPQSVRPSLSSEPAGEGGSQEENPNPLEILNQLVANRGWDNQQFEREIFGSPGDVVNLHSRLKRIPFEAPPSPRREHEINAELLPSCLDEFRLPEPGMARSRKPSAISRGLQKVEGLRALNIELPWNAYTFLPSTTIEKLSDLDSKPVDDVPSDDDSSSRDGHSFVSKRFKSEHHFHLADQPWLNLADFIDQSSCASEASCSRLEGDGSKDNAGRGRDGDVSIPDSTRRSTSLAARTDQDLQAVPETQRSSSDSTHSPQTNPFHIELPQGHEDTQADFFGSPSQSPRHTSFDDHSALTEDDKVMERLGLGSVDSTAGFKNRGGSSLISISLQLSA